MKTLLSIFIILLNLAICGGTASPTIIPTRSPTISPSAAPSVAPSRPPTLSPAATTVAPTRSPTTAPSVTPTHLPTLSPAATTVAPTRPPTIAPSAAPSVAPSRPPTLSPAATTVAPTRSPTTAPSVIPTHLPTLSPAATTVAPTRPPTIAPSVTPTRVPTVAPSVTATHAPTLSPAAVSANPTRSPTVAPSITATHPPTLSPATTTAPTHTPSHSPTLSPAYTPAPSHSYTPTPYNHTATPTTAAGAPTAKAGVAATDPDSPGTTAAKVTSGLIVGAIGAAGVMAGTYIYAVKVADGLIDREVVNGFIVRGMAAASVLMAILSIGLVGGWAQQNDVTSKDNAYLGTPDWTDAKPTGYLAYHSVLMVIGFFLCQVFAILTWIFCAEHTTAKYIHVFWQTTCVFMMMSGWIAIMKYQSASDLPTLTTMHSWIGVITVVVFGFNYFLGLFMAALTAFYPDFVVRQAINFRYQHRKLGMIALILTTVAIVTGIMDQLPQGMCYYSPNDDTMRPGYDTDPSSYYAQQSNSCRVAMGLGITVMLTTFFALSAIVDRDQAAVETTPNRNTNVHVSSSSGSNSSAKRAIPSKARATPPPPSSDTASRPTSKKETMSKDEENQPDWMIDDDDVENGKHKSRRTSTHKSSSKSSSRRRSAIQMETFSTNVTPEPIPVAIAVEEYASSPTRRSSTNARNVPPPPNNTNTALPLSSRRRSALESSPLSTTMSPFAEASAPPAHLSYMVQETPELGAIPPPPSYRPSMTPILMEQAAHDAVSINPSSPTPNRLPGRRSSQTKTPPPPPPRQPRPTTQE